MAAWRQRDKPVADQIKTDWIAADWGTSRLRVWAMRGSSVAAAQTSDRGMNTLTPEQFEPALLDLIGPWLGDGPADVVICGMAGARQGWVEAPYAPVPAKPADLHPVSAPCTDPRLRVWILPGLSQSKPPDVMRGEETQIAGFLTLNPGWDGVICLPGTHTKWVHVSAGEVVSFQTLMTGELFALLSTQSVLRHSVRAGGTDMPAFLDGLDTTLSRPERLAGDLFALRAADLVSDQDPGAAGARLSGLLIGAELAATRPYWLGQQIAVVGDGALARAYAAALDHQGVPVLQSDGGRMTLAGLTAAHRRLGTA